MQFGLCIECGVISGVVFSVNEQVLVVEEGCDLFGFEWLVQFGVIVVVVQYWDLQVIVFDLGFVVGDVYQFDQQVMFDEGYQYCFCDFVEVVIEGFEELVFWGY